MKKLLWIFLFVPSLCPVLKAQSFEAEQLALDIEKLRQLKLMLADLKKGYETLYKGYSTIRDISQRNFLLHQVFLDGLLDVSPAIRNYKKVAEIISIQLRIVSEYKSAFSRLRLNKNFTPGEINYIGKVYAALFDESVKNLETLAMVLTSGVLRMTDDERLKQIDALHDTMIDKLSFLRHFNNQNNLLAVQRARAQNENSASKKLYGLNN